MTRSSKKEDEPPQSPFSDEYEFQDMIPEDMSVHHTSRHITFNAPPGHEGYDSDDSMPQTPIVHSGRFEEEVETFDDDPDNAEMKRARWGTQRNAKGKPKVGRAKTLRFKKGNFHNPFENNQDEDEHGERDRAGELRSVYFNVPLPEEMLDEHGHPVTEYSRNKIRTTKYTPLSFLPKNILFQFRNVANVYFLVLVILGAFPIFGVASPGLAAAPLVVIVLITAVKDAVEDSRRTLLDMEVNNMPTHILHGVLNNNVSDDNISLWRKFKKACTRVTFAAITWMVAMCTKDGREKYKMEKEQRQRELHSSQPRNSLDSVNSFRASGMYNRQSLDITRVATGAAMGGPTDMCVIDRSKDVPADARFKKDYWKSVKVGDIVRIHNNDEIPADVILLSTSDSDGGCYIETKNLDGETNLKVRNALKCTTMIRSPRDIARSAFWVESEGPHSNLYNYQGNLKWETDQGIRNEPVTINNMLLRGCFLRNTKWAIGVVVFTGDDTKIMLNAGITPTKKSRIARELNWSVILNFIILFIICLIPGIINGVYYRHTTVSRTFFEFGTIAGSPVANGIVSFFVAVILYQSLVPISLYISIEIIKTAQAAFIYGDVLMYYPKLDYPCTPKSWNISDDLGQIEYIFSDKTGTLTQNLMEFKKCTINGVSYGRAYTEALAGLRKRQGIDVDEEGARERAAIAEEKEQMVRDLANISKNSQFYPEDVTFVSKEFVNDLNGASGENQRKSCQHFMLALALCHSVITEASKNDPDRLELKAQSPDEAALVGTARDMGFSLVGRTKHGLVLEVQGVTKEFQVLNTLEFNSTRKRMSAIIKLPGEGPNDEPKALLICKGADSVIYSRLKRGNGACNDEVFLEKTANHLEEYAVEGLRTLCIAQRELTWSEYKEWNKRHEIAAASLTNREEQMEEVADSIERELMLLGGTAIEDKLQDGVPDSIALLADAGIKLWVLTGDKVATAINIGFSCNLLNNDMELLVIKASDTNMDGKLSPQQIIESQLDEYLSKFGLTGDIGEINAAKEDHGVPTGNYGVVIDGDALKIALTVASMKFLLLCKQCKAVLCCRVSPAQKAAVVKLVKNTLDVMTLAIGDGSNDVAMIQAADVGVGIAGEEGRQAVMSSDYAIGQFRFLTRLVLVHGRWCYKRLAEMIPSFFYKNVIFTFSLFWYGVYNNYDGSYLFEFTYLTFYNLAFTSLPVIFMGILDQDVSDKVSLLVPQLYRVGIERTEWHMTKFWYYMLDGFYQSIISFFWPYLVYYKTGLVTNNGMDVSHRFWMGIAVASIAVCSCNLYVMLHQYRWDWFTVLFISLSCLVVWGWTGIYSSVVRSGEFYKSAQHVYGQPYFWAVLFIGILTCLLPRFVYDMCVKLFNPHDVDVVREMWQKGEYDHYPEDYDPTDPSRPKIAKREALVFDKIGTNGTSTEDIPLGPMSSEDSGMLVHRFSGEEMRRIVTQNTRPSMDSRRPRASLDLPGLTKATSLMAP